MDKRIPGKTTVEVPLGAVERAVVEAYKVGRRGGTLRKIRLEGRAVTFIWDEPPKAAGLLYRLASFLRGVAAKLDPEPAAEKTQGGEDARQPEDRG